MYDDYFPSTQRTLMSLMLKTEDEVRLVALGCFYERYRNALARVLQGKLGIQPVDADEILNDFMLQRLLQGSFIEKYVAWREDPRNSQRRFRQYLARSIHNFAIDWLRRQRPTADLDRLAPPGDVEVALEAAYDIQWLQELLTAALRRTRDYYLKKGAPQHWEVFLELLVQPDLLGIKPPTHEEIAIKYALTQKVSTVLTNAQRMYTKQWREVLAEELGTSDPQAIEDAIHDLKRSTHMFKYVDARRLLLQIIQDDVPENKSVNEEQLSRLFALASDQLSDLVPSEQRMLLQCYLGMPLKDYLPDEAVADLPGELTETSVEALLTDQGSNVASIREVSRLLGGLLRDRHMQIPRPVAGLIRYALIAFADQEFGELISSVPRAHLAEGMQSVLRHEMLDDRIRSLLEGFVARCCESRSAN